MIAERLRVHRTATAPAAETDDPEAPLTLFRLGSSLLWDNLAGLVALNLAGTIVLAPLAGLGLMLGFVPFVVASAAFSPIIGGLIGAVTGVLRGEPGGLRRRFLATIRTRWRPLFVVGLCTSGFLASCLITTARVIDGGGAAGAGTTALWLAQCVVLVLFALLLIYVLPLTAAYGAGLRPAVCNALVLAVSAPLQTLGQLGLLVLLAVATLWVGPGMWLIVPVVAAVFLAANCWLQVKRIRSMTGPA